MDRNDKLPPLTSDRCRLITAAPSVECESSVDVGIYLLVGPTYTVVG